MNRIKIVLSKQGRMQSFLCRELDKSPNTVSLWCTNKIQPSVQDLYKVAEILDCEVDELLVKKDELKDKK